MMRFMEQNHTDELIEKLAVMIADRFDQVDERLDKVEGRLGVVESDLIIVKSNVAEIKTNVDDLRNDQRKTKGDIERFASVAEVSDLNDRVKHLESIVKLKPALA